MRACGIAKSRRSRFLAGMHVCHAALLACAFFLSLAPARAEDGQPALPIKVLSVGQASVRAEIADSDAERARGYMHRKSVADGEGMLFVFAAPQPLSFWMKNTTVPLSIAYISASGLIREIHDLKPLDESTVASEFDDLLYALEVPQGWFARHKILPGDRVLGLPAPPPAE